MVKNKLLVGLASAAVILSGAAFANGGSMDSSYAAPMAATSGGGDGGSSGIFVGLNAGYGLTHWNNLEGTSVSGNSIQLFKVNNPNGFTGGALVGYQFNKNFGIEGAWEYLPSNVAVNGTTSGSTKVKSWAADISGVLSAPIQDKFGVFGQIGVGYLRATGAPDISSSSNTGIIRQTLGIWNVVVGAGAYYDITDQIRANLSWKRYNGYAKINKHYQPNPDLFLVGLQYRFNTDLFGGSA